MPCKPRVVCTKRKTPSTETFLGDSYERFWPVGNYATSNGSSARESGTENVPSPASKFTLKSISRSITDCLFAVLNQTRMWFFKEFITVPFAVDAWARLIPQPTKQTSSIDSTAAATSPELIKTVPMLPFPIRVFYGKPPPFSLEAQRRKMRWRCLWHWALAPELIPKLDTQRIQETVQQYVEYIAPETETIREIVGTGSVQPGIQYRPLYFKSLVRSYPKLCFVFTSQPLHFAKPWLPLMANTAQVSRNGSKTLLTTTSNSLSLPTVTPVRNLGPTISISSMLVCVRFLFTPPTAPHSQITCYR